jgi:proteasome accessory factor C
MDKWEKVIALHRILESHRRPVSLSFICENLECSEPTFHRIRQFMVDTLSAPIVFDGKYRGYKYDLTSTDRFELPGLWLTSRETEVLLGFHQAIESLQKGFFSEIFAPMKKQLTRFLKSQNLHNAHNELLLRIVPLHSRPVADAVFRKIADAVIRKRTIIICHDRLAGESPVKRTVSPLSIIRYRDNWYLDAYCHLRSELRTFSLDRINSAECSDHPFHHVPKKEQELFYASAYGIFNGPARKTAQIIFCSTAAEIVSREQWHPQQQAQWTPDNNYLLTLPYNDDRELIMDILKWGEFAEVVSPPELRAKVKSLLSNTLRKYEK